MAADDYALLVGIARYRDPARLPTLSGPLNDVQRVRDWLTDPDLGEGVPPGNVKVLATPQEWAHPDTDWPPREAWSPNRESFDKRIRDIVYDDQGRTIRRQGRLYLYFSGHGFSRYEDDTPKAALFSADVHGDLHSNLAGTAYATAIKRARMFKEIILIMDCCRDVLNNHIYDLPNINQVENSSTEAVNVYAMYAAPKRGKAQERELPDSEGKVVGLMTDGLLRALKQAPADLAGRIAGSKLKWVIASHWNEWYPQNPAPPAPRVVDPEGGEIYFRSRRPLVPVTFTCPAGLVPGSEMRLISADWNARATVRETSLRWRDATYSLDHEIPLEREASDAAQRFTLRLPPGEHTLIAGATTYRYDPETTHAVVLQP